MLDELSAKLYLEERMIKLKKRLVKERHDYTFLIRIHTNTIRCVNKILLNLTNSKANAIKKSKFKMELLDGLGKIEKLKNTLYIYL